MESNIQKQVEFNALFGSKLKIYYLLKMIISLLNFTILGCNIILGLRFDVNKSIKSFN